MVRKNPEDDPSNKYRYRQSDLYKDYMNRLDFEHELILPIRLTHTPTRDRFCVYNG